MRRAVVTEDRLERYLAHHARPARRHLLMIEFDYGGVKRVIDSYVVRSEDSRPPD